MKRIALIVLWIGKLPDYFPIWLYSCGKNPTVDFFVFTDDTADYCYPANVKKEKVSFEELRQRFRRIFPFEISMERPYKLCDYRPAYGEAFAEYLQGYDFWGYCDVDLIWGNIREFLTNGILEENERIFTRGHCSLFRNQAKVNAYYRTLPAHGHLDYKEVYQSPESWCYDEWAEHCGGGTSVIFKENGIRTYDEPVMADIDIYHGDFHICRRPDLKKVTRFLYENGNLYVCGKQKNGTVFRTPVLYCHFQKRKLTIDRDLDGDRFQLTPPGEIQREGKPRNLMAQKCKIWKFDGIVFLKKIWSGIKKKR